MSRIYKNISANLPRRSRDPKGEDDVFRAEFEMAQRDGVKKNRVMYRVGKVPEGVDEDEEEDDVDLLGRKKKMELKIKKQFELEEKRRTVKERRRRVEAVVVEDAEDAEEEVKEADEQKGGHTIHIKQEPTEAEALSIDTSQLEIQGEDSDSDEESEEDDVSSRRARARARFKQKQEEEKKVTTQQAEIKEEEEDEEGEGDSSEYETDTDDEDDYLSSSRPLLKPVFVSKKARETIEERERIEAEKRALEEEKEMRAKERKKESRLLVVEEVKREEELEANPTFDGAEEELPNDDDDEDDEEELEKWKIRELQRVKRDKLKEIEYEKEQAQLAKRREMTDEEIAEADRAKRAKQKEKVQMRFLQKYYHKGSFFTTDSTDEVYDRDFMQPTLDDRTVDRTLLPEVLQVKKFGLKGRTKYTHLNDQDTTQNNENEFSHGYLEGKGGYGAMPRGGVREVGVMKRRMGGTGSLDKKKKRRK